jgi:hypothetical protein
MEDWLAVVIAALSLAVSGAGLMLARRSLATAERSATAAVTSAAAADRSAEVAQQNMDIAKRMAAIAEASLRIGFRIDVTGGGADGIWFNVYAVGANVHVRSLSGDIAVVAADGKPRLIPGVRLRPVSASISLPSFLHDGEGRSFLSEQPVFDRDTQGLYGFLNIEYALGREREAHVRSAYCEWPKGIGQRYVSSPPGEPFAS